MILNQKDQTRLMTFYQDYMQPNPSEHIRFFAKTDLVTITMYHSGKVMFQGEDAKQEYQMWESMLGISATEIPIPKPTFTDYFYSSIGSDEVGTGDVFGPVTVCAAYLPVDMIDYVQGLGIDDSKKLTDEKILIIGEQLKNKIPYSLLTLHNEKYNELVRQGFNLNKMKAYMHNKAIIHVLKKINGTPEVIMDQFAEESLYFRYLASEQDVYQKITFLTKAESKYASVAIASIIARYAFLKHFDILSKETGYPLLKGAGAQVDVLLAKIIKEKGEGYLESFTKCNFKNIEKAKEILKNQ